MIFAVGRVAHLYFFLLGSVKFIWAETRGSVRPQLTASRLLFTRQPLNVTITSSTFTSWSQDFGEE